jgi:hypothetical protein
MAKKRKIQKLTPEERAARAEFTKRVWERIAEREAIEGYPPITDAPDSDAARGERRRRFDARMAEREAIDREIAARKRAS